MFEPVEEILAKLVSFDTTSRNSNRALIDYVQSYLEKHGVSSEIVSNEDGQKAALWATIGETTQKGIVIAGHTDVVPVDGQKWISEPFTLIERDEKLYGRGSSDMKGFIACALAFVPEFLAAKANGCFHLALTYDEETDMSGAQRLADYLARNNVKPAWIWIGEPTGLTVVDQHKGVAVYRTNITGVPYHSSQPDKGVNAITRAAEFITLIGEAAERKKEKLFAPSRFDPPYTTFNMGMVTGGTASNIIAQNCELIWEVRAHPGDTAKASVDEINGLAEKLTPRAEMKTCACYDIPPFTATADNPGSRTLKRLLKCDQTHAVGFATEAGIFQKLGAAAVVCGPGFLEQAHQPDEYIDKNQLEACVDLMRAVLLSSSAPRSALNRS